MEKLKQIFSPGSTKDDQVLYGDEEARRQASVGNTAQAGQHKEIEPLRPIEDSKESGGVLRQILNPGGEKYDDHAFGANATTEPVDPKLMQTHPEHQKDHSILGQILNPGGEKYDEQRYGTTGTTGGDARRESVRPEVPPSVLISSDAKLATDDTKKDHSVLRQIINPRGDNYDSVAYGRNASVVGAEEHQRLQNDPVNREDKSSISRQILNSNQEKYDPVIHGAGQSSASGSAPGAATSSTTATQRDDYAQPSQYGSAVAGAGTSTLPDRTARTSTTDDAAVAGGLGAAGAGTYAATHHHNEQKAYADPPGTAQSTASSAYSQPGSQTTTHQADHSQLGRDAGIAGTAASGTGAYALDRHVHPQEADLSTKITDRAHPLSNRGTDGHINPVSAPEASITQADSHFNRDAAVVGGTGIATIAAADQLHGSSTGAQSTGAGAAYTRGADSQLNQAPSDVQKATYTERAVPLGSGAYRHPAGPHQTDTANRLDPHIPGEFPVEQGDDPYSLRPDPVYGEESSPSSGPGATVGAGVAAAGAGATAYGLSGHDDSKEVPQRSGAAIPNTSGQSYPVQTSETATSGVPSQTPAALPTSEHHYGRDAALRGAGLAGAGTAAYGVSEHDKSRHAPGQSVASSTYSGGQSYPTQTTTGVGPTGTSVLSQSQGTQDAPQHHHGRDAAIAGGAGAAGLGAYEASKGRDDTGPASKTIGPHDSNIANIVDPRVQPEPQKMKQSTTAGPYQSDLANKADPRVDSDPSKHDKGKDAALLAGGAGAGAAAGYGASHVVDEKEQKKLEKQHHKELEKEHKEAEKDAKKHEKEHQKEVAKEEKAHHKEAEKQEKAHQKEIAKAEKQHEKEVAKEEKKHEKEAAKAEKQHEKEIAKEEKQHEKEVAKEEKKHEKELTAEEKEAERTREKREKEIAAAAGTSSVGAGAYEAEKHHHDSFGEQQGRSSYDTNETGHSSEKKRGLLDKILHPTRKSEDDNRVAADEDGHNKLHKKHAPKATEQVHQGSSPLASSNQGDLVAGPEYAGRGDGSVTEPHTGLPINVEQYGSGQGGTDRTQTIEGYHQHPSATGGESAVTGPDWNAIKKDNTPY